MANKKKNTKKVTTKKKVNVEELVEEEEIIESEEDAIKNKKIMGIAIGILVGIVAIVLILVSIQNKSGVNYTTTEVNGKTIYVINDVQ